MTEPKIIDFLKKVLVSVTLVLLGTLWMWRFEYTVIPSGTGEYGVLVRIHRYSGRVEMAFPNTRVWHPVGDPVPSPAGPGGP